MMNLCLDKVMTWVIRLSLRKDFVQKNLTKVSGMLILTRRKKIKHISTYLLLKTEALRSSLNSYLGLG